MVEASVVALVGKLVVKILVGKEVKVLRLE